MGEFLHSSLSQTVHNVIFAVAHVLRHESSVYSEGDEYVLESFDCAELQQAFIVQWVDLVDQESRLIVSHLNFSQQ
jgi:hypothetical protein